MTKHGYQLSEWGFGNSISFPCTLRNNISPLETWRNFSWPYTLAIISIHSSFISRVNKMSLPPDSLIIFVCFATSSPVPTDAQSRFSVTSQPLWIKISMILSKRNSNMTWKNMILRVYIYIYIYIYTYIYIRTLNEKVIRNATAVSSNAFIILILLILVWSSKQHFLMLQSVILL